MRDELRGVAMCGTWRSVRTVTLYVAGHRLAVIAVR